MHTLERQDFLKRFGATSNRMSKLKPGDEININGHLLKVLERKCVREKINTVKFSEGNETYLLDLAPHWERGPQGEIQFCHEGVVNLIQGIYQQTADDLEALYSMRPSDYPCERLFMEHMDEYTERKKWLYEREVKNAEDFLGSVLANFVKVKAYYNMGKPIEEIAEKLKWTVEHTVCVIDRLGLNRATAPQNEEF